MQTPTILFFFFFFFLVLLLHHHNCPSHTITITNTITITPIVTMVTFRCRLSDRLKRWYDSARQNLRREQKEVFEKILDDLRKHSRLLLAACQETRLKRCSILKMSNLKGFGNFRRTLLKRSQSLLVSISFYAIVSFSLLLFHCFLVLTKELVEDLKRISRIILRDPENEATYQIRINSMLLKCLDCERNRAETNNQWTLAPMALAPETDLELEITMFGKKITLYGRADYTLWYDDFLIGTNLVIIEAKKRDSATTGIPQCLGYMGMLFYSTLFFPPRI
jgi:hypothetical protein